jgi:WD40 repeat protein
MIFWDCDCCCRDPSANCLAFSPDSSRLADGSDDHNVYIRSLVDNEPVFQQALYGHSDEVHSVAWSPTGANRLASASADKTLRIWDTAGARCMTVLRGHSDSVTSVAFSPDGSRLVSASRDSTLRVWSGRCECTLPSTYFLWQTSFHTGDFIACLRGHDGEIYSATWSPTDANRLVSGGADAMLRVWDPETRQCLNVLHGHSDVIFCVDWNGSRLASASADSTVRLWDAASGDCLKVCRGHRDGVTSVAWSPDGRCLASGSHDGTVRIWDAATGQCLSKLVIGENTEAVTSVAWSPDILKLACSHAGGGFGIISI